MPRFPFAQAVAIWVGVQQGFNGMNHNPAAYAERVRCPTLLLQGDQDQSVGPPFVRNVAERLGPTARFELIAGAGHAFLVTRAATVWRRSLDKFLATAVKGGLGSGPPAASARTPTVPLDEGRGQAGLIGVIRPEPRGF